jgi:hypothetical protein
MSRRKKSTVDERVAAEAKRRQHEQARAMTARMQYWSRLAAALAVTDEFEWKPWGYLDATEPAMPARVFRAPLNLAAAGVPAPAIPVAMPVAPVTLIRPRRTPARTRFTPPARTLAVVATTQVVRRMIPDPLHPGQLTERFEPIPVMAAAA